MQKPLTVVRKFDPDLDEPGNLYKKEKIMDKRFWISGVVAFLILFTGSYLVHGMWLTADYMRRPQLFRPEAEAGSHFIFMVLAFISMGFAFAWIYRQGISANRSPVVQGLRFGVAAACLSPLPMYLIYYVVQPMEGATTAKQIIGDSITLIITGVVVALICGQKQSDLT